MSTAILPARPSVHNSERSFVRLHVAAAHCSVSTSTVRRLCNSQLVECRRTPVGGHRLVDLAQVCEVIGVAPPAVRTTENEEGEQAGRLIVGYCRVSTAKQRIAGALERQKERVEQYIKTTFPGERFIVLAEQASGTNADRKKLGKLIDLALASKISTCVCEWPDRVSRGSYGIISRLLEKCGVKIVVTRTGEKENDAKSAEEEVLHDALCAIYCVQAKAHGRRGLAKQTLMPPDGFKERVAQLAGAGLSRVDITAQIERERWVCTNTAKRLGVRSVRLVLESLPAGSTLPSSLKSFIAKRCTIGAGKRETSSALYSAYVDHCEGRNDKPLNRDRWTAYMKQAVPGLRLENERITTVFGICLKASRNV
jgi:predicted site-specific integrase-resolvase